MRHSAKPTALWATALLALAFTAGPAHALTSNVWTNASTNNSYNDGTNWSLGHVPTSTEVATFNTTSTADCTLDTTVNVEGIDIQTGYTGTVQQGAGQAITIGISGFLQSDGTFTGTTGNITLGNTSPFQLLGGAFTSTGSTLTLRNEFLVNGGSFTHNSGTVVFTFSIGSGTKTINITANGTAAFNNLTFTGSPTNPGNSITFAIQAGDTLQVASLFTFKRSGGAGPLVANGGTIELSGNVDFGSGASGGTTLLKFLSTGSQTYTNADSQGRLPVVEVDMAGGSLSAAAGTTRFGSTGFTLTQGTFDGPTGTHENRGSFTVTAGAYNHNNGTLLQTISVGSGAATLTINVPGTLTLGSLSLQGSPVNPGNTIVHVITSGDIVHLVGDLDLRRTSGSGPVRVRTNGTIEVEGDITMENISCDSTGGGTLITLTGTNDQTITHTSGTPPTGNWTVDKTGGSASLLTALTLNAASQQLIVDQGTFDCNGFGLTVNSAITVNSGGNFQLQGGESISPDPTFNAGSLATYTGNGDSNPDTFVLKNWVPYQSIDIAGTDAAEVFELPTNLSVNENLTLTSGTLDATASNFDVNLKGNWTEAGGVFDARAGDVEFQDSSKTSTISGTTTFFDFTCVTANKTLTFEAGTTQNITGTLTLTGTSGNQVVLNSTSPGTQWRIRTQDDENTRAVSFVDVTDSVNLGIPMIFTNPPNDPTGSSDNGDFSNFLTTLNWFTNVTPVSITATAGPDDANGSTWTLDATTADGFAPYSWLWTSPTAGVSFTVDTNEDTTVDLTGAAADTVITLTVTVTDDNGFTDSFDVLVIRTTAALDVTARGTPAAGSESTGNVWDITSTASGGVPAPGQSLPNDYTYTWTASDGGVTFGDAGLPTTTADLTGATADTDITLTITVKDLFGTTDSFDITVYRSSTGITATASAVYVTAPVPDPFNPKVIVVTGTVNAFTLTGVLSDAGGPITPAAEEWNDVTAGSTFLSNTNPLTLDAPGTAGTYTYEYRGTDSHGLIGIGTVDVFVVDPIVPNPAANPPILDLFINTSTNLTATPTGGAPQAGSGGYTVEWLDLDTNTVIADPTNYAPTGLGLHTVQVTVTDELGNVGIDTLGIPLIESALVVVATGTENLGGITVSGNNLVGFAGGTLVLSSDAFGGTGTYEFAWTGPNGFTSTAEDPGAVTLPFVPGVYVFTVFLTDPLLGQTVSDTVTIEVFESINNQGLYVANGKCRYKATTASTPFAGKDYAKIWLEGVAFNPGDRVAFDFNGRAIGDIAGGSSIVLDGIGKGTGQLGPVFGPNFFPKVVVKYKASRFRLEATCAKGDFDPFGQGAPIASSVTGLSTVVNVTVFVDRAPADNVVDETIVLPLMFKVRAKLSPSDVYTESGKKVAP